MVAIIGVLAAVGVVAFNGFINTSKVNATMQSHNNVVKFIRTNLMKCNISGELILNTILVQTLQIFVFMYQIQIQVH